ncbi:MAG: amino acid permease, partial [Lentisphaeria bacterium]|nr:amino acid permease [Lentisphaeria bacterium]
MSVFPKKSNKMGVFTLSMLNIAAVLSIVNFPEQAEYGYAIIFYITAASICFFIPTALVSAELAAAWPKDGGMYLWVKEAFGPKWGFVAVCMQWLNSLPWYATVLTFVATTLAYIFKPELATNRWFVFLTLAAVMWGCTILNFRGIRLYAILSSIGAIFGTIIPTAAIILLAALYLFGGHAPAIPFTPKAVLPELNNLTQWMLLAGMMVAIAGIDMPAVHVTDVDNPQKNFPKAILISSIIIIFLSIAGSLSISLIVPPGRLSMASGAAEAFDQMFTAMGARWMTPVMCVFLIWGALTTIITWTLGPSKGLLQVAREGYLPEFW